MEWEMRQRNQAGVLHWCPSWWHLGTTCETCAIRLNDLPNLFYQQVGSSGYGPKSMFGLGLYSQYALEALGTGFNLGSITCFSFHFIRSNPSRVVPVSYTVWCSCRGWGWTADLTKLKDSGMAILSRVVHQFNSMKLLSKTCLHLFQEKLEKQGDVADSQITQPYGTWGHSFTRKLPICLKTASPMSLYLSKSVPCRPYWSFLPKIFSFTGLFCYSQFTT